MNPLKRLARSFVKDLHIDRPFWEAADDVFRWPYLGTWGAPDRETIENNLEGYIHDVYKADGIVWACIAARQNIFAQARFQWIRFTNGMPGQPFGDPGLSLLERPWPGGTLGDLMALMEVDVSLAGNFWATVVDDNGNFGRAARGNRRIVRMRPDWVELVIDAPSGNPNALDARVVAVHYKPPVSNGKEAPEILLLPDEVCHYSPQPDPEAKYRGMSWLTPVIKEVMADKATTKHKLKFFENAATPNLAVSLPKEVTAAQFEDFVDKMNKQHKGVDKAYKTLYTAGGADVTVIGANLQQLDFKATQGHGETRIAAASGVHPVIVALSEGLQGSSLNAGNFNAARRLSADKLFRYLWQQAAAALETLLDRPRNDGAGVELWPDLRLVSFLQEDRRDQAEIQEKEARTMRELTDAGFEPESVKRAVLTQDWTALAHTGLFSVQLQPPGTVEQIENQVEQQTAPEDTAPAGEGAP